MSERETAETISEQALRWIALLDRRGQDPLLRAELDTWLAGDTRRQGAFLRAEAAWTSLDRAGILAAPDREGQPAAPAVSRRRLLVGGGGLAAGLAVAATGWWAVNEAAAVKIGTARGEIRRVPLEDGSMAMVNTDTFVKVELQPRLRTVTLNKGEAWFAVAPDRDRPFVVAAGDIRVRAVGTAFSVRRLAEGALVQVTEGVVETWSVGKEAEAIRVSQGGKAFVAPAAEPAVAPEASAEIARTLAWRTGQIVLNGDTLGEAAAEFNRYNDRQIVIVDEGLAVQTYVGRFRTNEPEAFVQAVALTLGTRTQTTPDAFLIYRQ